MLSFRQTARAWLVGFLAFAALSLQAQDIERNVEERLQNFFSQYTSSQVDIGPCKLDSVRIDYQKKHIDIYANARFAYQPFRPETTGSIYRSVQRLLPGPVYYFDITLWTDGQTIESLIPNYYRKNRDEDERRLYGKDLEYKGKPWVSRVSPVEADRGLTGTHLALWQSHGRYYANAKDRWEWQRPRLFCTTEDLFTQSFVVPYLIPMLEHAGACVYTPRERDWQRHEVIVDNDKTPLSGSSLYIEEGSRKARWQQVEEPGFAHRKATYEEGENPFETGTARYVATEKKKERAFAQWVPDIPERGEYAVYVSYRTLPESVSDARYLVFHNGGVTEFHVNQQMGGGTWVYLGTFSFDQGRNDYGMVVLSNQSGEKGVVCADAVRFGGGMGNISRGGQLSGLPRYLEGARYAAQWSGMPATVYSRPGADNDYADDINTRSRVINHLAGGSLFNPDEPGLGVPFELSVALHSDAGAREDDRIVGSLGIYTTDFNGGLLGAGTDRYASRDLSDLLLSQLRSDLRSTFNVDWTRRSLWNRNYSETRLPAVPSTIIEMLSHQNFADMRLGHDPNFKFAVGRSLYKGILRYLARQHGRKYVVQPLPVSHFAVQLEGKRQVRLSWRPVEDPLEPSAVAEEYMVYTRIGRGGFDNGVRVSQPSYEVKLEPGIVYSFRVSAVNRGGESFPSETLSAYFAPDEKGRVLIVNGFDRISGPAVIDTEAEAGFDLAQDPGVPYLYDMSLCGAQTDFLRSHTGGTLGTSGSEWEGMLRAGNTFDYPFVHGKAIQAAGGYSFASCSDEAVESGAVSLEDYGVVDYLLGLEKADASSNPARNVYYKTFTSSMQRALAAYCRSGGRLLVSGAYAGSDMQGEGDRSFTAEVLKFECRGTVITEQTDWQIAGPGGIYRLHRLPNEAVYALPSADDLRPVGTAFTPMVYAEGRQSAAVAYRGDDYRVYVMGFPFEGILGEDRRAVLMTSILHFLAE